MERFLLDQIDGNSDLDALSDATMIDVAALRRMLVHLASLGVVMFTTTAAVVQPASAGAPADADMDKTRAARIDHVATHLASATLYELLGVPGDADKALIKKAYFALSKEFHPDTQHGKKIGGYRAKMEAIFKRVTDAHDVLTRPKRRTEYDEELARSKRAPFVARLHPALDDAPPKPRAEATGVQSTPTGAASSSSSSDATARSPLGTPRAFAPPAPPAPPRPPGTSGPASVSAARPGAPGSPPPPSASGVRAPIATAASSPTSPGAVASPSVPRPPMPGSPTSPGAPVPGATSGIRLPSSVAVPRPQPPVATVQAPAAPPISSLRGPSLAGAPRPLMGNPPSGSSLRPPSTPGTARPVTTSGPASSASAPRPGVGSSTSSGGLRAPISNDQAERIARDLARQTGNAASSSTPPTRGDADAMSAADRERSLKRALHGASQLTGAVDRIALYERQALQLEVAGDIHGALSCLRAALQFDASRADLRATHDRLDRMVAALDVEANRTRARNEEKAGRFAQAFAAWGRVCLGAPADADALGSAARCCLEGGLDLRQGRDFAQRWVDLRPDDVEPRILLARIFRSAGMRLNAIRELEVAAKLDPGNQLVKNLQRELK